jgi:hypothetical protein
LANSYSKHIHAQHRHKQEWAAYQEYVKEEKEKQAQARQDKQLEATLAIAGKAGGQDASVPFAGDPSNPGNLGHTGTPTPKGMCDICGRDGLKNVGAHKRGAHGGEV